ncbi:MAG: homoserine O-acetyltransferase [Paludibacteraceae bacterium]
MNIYTHDYPFYLESGQTLHTLQIAYHTFGTLSAAKDNVIWVCHALTANSDVADWWPHTVEAGRFLDPTRYFIVCANILGSCYGTTGPTSICPNTGEPWYGDFPKVTVRDMVHAHQVLARALGIEQVQLLIGASIGGFQALEWAVEAPQFAKRFAFIATGMTCTPWIAAFNESQRMAMELDPTLGERNEQAGRDGMAVARSIALLSYRGGAAYNLSQADAEEPFICSPPISLELPDRSYVVRPGDRTSMTAGEMPTSPVASIVRHGDRTSSIAGEDACAPGHSNSERVFKHRVQTYQRYQGEKLRKRFNAYSYLRMMDAVDSHRIPAGEPIHTPTLVVAISSDLLFTPEEHQTILDRFPNHEFHVIDSPFGHDGFLVEADLLDEIIKKFMLKGTRSKEPRTKNK